MSMKSISPIIATILIIVMTVAIAGLFYAFTSGLFGSLTQSSSQQIQQQSQITSFTINNVYCSNNILYFNIYNNGNIPININNSQIIFTDNNGNTISINGSNIICNNGNIIPSGSNSLCYVENYICYYDYIDYIKSTNFVYNGINYNYEILNNKFMIHTSFFSITIYNTQNSPTPSPFQQDIAICNGNPNLPSSFAYVNKMLFNGIDSNGQNVYFTTTYNSTPNIYSWYEGQENLNGTYCDVWWVNIPNGIPANSNVTIYMNIGPNNANYYSQYYPYVGTNEQVIGTIQYDNGNYVFLFYDNFAGTSLNTSKWISAESSTTITVNNGLTVQSSGSCPYGGIITSSSFPTNTIFDAYLHSFTVQSSSYNGAHGIGVQVGNSASSNGYEYTSWTDFNPNGGTIAYGSMQNGMSAFLAGPNFPTSNSIISGYWVSTGNEGFGVNYYFVSTNNNAVSNPGYNYYSLGAYSCAQSATSVWYWARIRYMPPNNVMPSIYIS